MAPVKRDERERQLADYSDLLVADWGQLERRRALSLFLAGLVS